MVAAAIPAVVAGTGLAIGELERKQERDALARSRRTAEAGREDLGQRREATYRSDRQGLQGAIDQYYQSRGWKVPERLPGAFTTRALPGEAPLYPNKESESESKESAVESESATPISSAPIREEAVIVPEGVVTTQPVVRGAAEVGEIDANSMPKSKIDNTRFMKPLIFTNDDARNIASRIR
jgi:hypothetical protein